MPRHLLPALALAAAVVVPATTASAQDRSSPNMSLVENVQYKQRYADQPANYGTDIEFANLRGTRYAIAGSYYNGMQIFDLSRPATPRRTAVYDCGVLQGDIQIFRAADRSGRTLATYTADSASTKIDGQCFKEAEKLGFATTNTTTSATGTKTTRGKQGTFIVDISNPRRPRTVSFIEIPQGSHNQTVHPSGGWLYNSNSELITSTSPAIEIIDIRDPDAPRKHGELALQTRPGLGTESHDITFNRSGTRAYSAALSHGVVIDTTKPGSPAIVSSFDDEAINVWHQSDPFTVRTKEGKKEFLIAEDEFAGAAGGPVCPSGAVHIYDITGENEKAPVKVGMWNIDDFGPTHDPEGTCTAHVLDIHEREQIMTLAFYNGGVRVVDLKGLATGEGIKAIGSYQSEDADTWSFKAPRVSRWGTFYAYGNDMARGLDVYKYDNRRPKATNTGIWVPGPALDAGAVQGAGAAGAAGKATGGVTSLVGAASGAAARATAAGASVNRGATSIAGYRMFCLIASQQQ